MADALDELKKLPAEERLKRLKEIEERDKKEIEAASKLIKESEGQIEEERKIKEQIPIPQLKAVDISSLFTENEKQMYATKHFVDSKGKRPELEETVKQEQQRRIAELDEMEKEKFFHELPTQDLYSIQKEIYQQTEQHGLGEEQRDNLYAIQREFGQRREAMENGSYKPTSEVVREILSVTEAVQKYKR